MNPMDENRFNRIKAGCRRAGIIIDQSEDAQRNLDFFDVEAATLNEDTILLREKPSASAVFEELIHTTQYKKKICDGSEINRIKCEIEAKKKLIKFKDAYGITNDEDAITRLQLEKYERKLKEGLGGGPHD